MPLLDVSSVLLDPDLAEMFTVIRRSESVGSDGRSVITPTTIPNQIGVVTATTPGDLLRRDDGQMMDQKISVVTPFSLRGPGNGFQPDQIIVGGVTFTVTQVLPFRRFGAGFTEVIASSMNAADPAP